MTQPDLAMQCVLEHALMHTKENNVDVRQCCACALVRALFIIGGLHLPQLSGGAHCACCCAQVGGTHSNLLTQASTPSLRPSATTMT